MASPIRQAYDEQQPPEPYLPSEEVQKLIAYLGAQRKAGEAAKRQAMRQAWTNLAFYVGRQHTYFNEFSERIEDLEADDWRVRITLNYVRSAVDTMIARATENRPTVAVMPATSDEDDQQAARACEKLVEHLWSALDMQTKLYEFTQLVFVTGTGVMKVYWDPERGEEYELRSPQAIEDAVIESYYEDGVAVPPESVRPTARTGAPSVEVINLMEFGWDPGAKDLDHARWAYHETSMHIDEIRQNWPEMGRYVTKGSTYDSDSFSAQLLKDFKKDTSAAESEDRVRVIEYFERPSPRHPKGFYAILAGEVLLEAQEFLPHGELPFVVARHKPVSGKLPGDGAVADLIPAQKELNKKFSQRIENANLMASPKWIVPEGSIAGDHITDEPGEIVVYDPSKPPPRAVSPPPLSPEHGMLATESINHIWQLAGVSDLSRGHIPSGLSGRTVGMASDLEATLLGPTIREIESAIGQVAQRFLQYWRAYMPTSITLRTIGRNAVLEAFEFHASDIRSSDVRVTPNSMLPKHPSYRREQILMLFQQGVLGAPNDPMTQSRARKLMEFADLDEVYGDNTKERQYSREVVTLIASGTEVEPQPWEDLVVRIEEIRDYMTCVDYRLLPPNIQQQFVKHLAWCYYYENQNAQGVPWWRHVLGEDLPPDQMQGEQPGGPPQQGPQMPQAPVVDAFGMPPEGAPPQGEIPLEQLMAMMGGGQAGTGVAIENVPESFPPGTRGPGVPQFEEGY